MKVPISATIDKTVKEKLQKLAKKELRSDSNMLEILLSEAIETREKLKIN